MDCLRLEHRDEVKIMITILVLRVTLNIQRNSKTLQLQKKTFVTQLVDKYKVRRVFI
jgi:hypothetical protein